MCGIGGFISRGIPAHPDRLLSTLQSDLAHRGPDASGGVSHRFEAPFGQGTVGLAHTRLSIIAPDVQAAAQPLESADGRYTLTFNGEVYNYRELAYELLALGHRVDPNSDTSVLIAAFAQWGRDCLSRLRGMFAFAIWDAREKRLTLARDAVGMKPLWLAQHRDGAIAFASEIRPLLALARARGERPATIDPRAVGECLTFKYVPDDRCLVAGISGLKPGHWVEIYPAQDSLHMRTGQWYRAPPYAGDAGGALGTAHVEAFEAALRDAVAIRLRADVPLGVFLSGGIDSSTIYALAAQSLGAAPDAFFVEFTGSEEAYSEKWAADAVVAHYGGRLHQVTLDPRRFADSLALATRHREAPLAEMADVALFTLARLASQSVKTVLSGEGADELLAGYKRYWGERLVAGAQRFVPRMADGAISAVAARLPYGSRRVSLLLEAMAERDFALRQARWFGAFSSADLKQFAPRLAPLVSGEWPAPDEWPDCAIQRAVAFDKAVWLPSNLLLRGDRMTMASGLEMRMPFMDVPLAQVASQLPGGAFVKGRTGKMALRGVSQRVLPQSVSNRPKYGFRVPFHEWARRELRDFVGDHLLSQDCRLTQFVERDQITALVERHNSRTSNEEKRLWALLALELSLRDLEPVL